MGELLLKRLRIGILTLVVVNIILLLLSYIVAKTHSYSIPEDQIWYPFLTELVFFLAYLFALRVPSHLPGPDGFKKRGFRVHRVLRALFLLGVAIASLYINLTHLEYLLGPIVRASNAVFGCVNAQPVCVTMRTTMILSILTGFLVVFEAAVAFVLRTAMVKAEATASQQDHPFDQSGYRPRANVETVSPQTTQYPGVGGRGMPNAQYQQPTIYRVQPEQQYTHQQHQQQQQQQQGYCQGHRQQQQQQYGSTPKYEEESTQKHGQPS